MFSDLSADDYDFSPGEGSKLESLFASASTSADSNKSLIYKPQIQPRKSLDNAEKAAENPSQSKGSSVSFVKVISLWKLDANNKYIEMGKHGLAIANQTSGKEIVIYKEKNNILVRKLIDSSFVLFNRKNSFSTFYDSSQVNWLIRFENEADQRAASDEIAKNNGVIKDEIESEESGKKSDKSESKVEENKQEKVEETADKDAVQKNEILSRITRMGQQILPMSSTKFEDSLSIENSKESTEIKAISTINERKNEIAAGQLISSQILTTPPVNYDTFGYLVAQNAELKVHLSQIAHKLDNFDSKKEDVETEEIARLKTKIRILETRSETLMEDLMSSDRKYNDLLRKYTALKENQTNPIDFANIESEYNKFLKLVSDFQDELVKKQMQFKSVSGKGDDQSESNKFNYKHLCKRLEKNSDQLYNNILEELERNNIDNENIHNSLKKSILEFTKKTEKELEFLFD